MRTFIIFLFLLLFTISLKAQNRTDPLKFSDKGNHITSKGLIRTLAVFIQFKDDTSHPESVEWPINHPPLFLKTYLDSAESQVSTPWSFSDYFREMSFDSLRIYGKCYSYFTKYPEKYYRDSLRLGNSAYSEVNREALVNLDSAIDFNKYDNWTFKSNYHVDTSDGKADLIIFLYRNSIYPPGEPAQGIAAAGYGKDLVVDNKIIRFGFPGSGITNSGGWRGMKETLRSVKHEFGHLLFDAGHPSYYNAGSKGQILYLGMWGIMPIPGYCANAYEREKLGWIKIINVEKNGSFILPDFASSGAALRIPVKKSNEVYILENHQQISIYDEETDRENAKGLYIYKVKGSSVHPAYQVECADGKFTWSNYWVHHPWSANSSDSLPVFTKVSPGKKGFNIRDWIPHDKPGYLNGKFQVFLMDDDGRGGKPYYVYEGWKGNGNTAFNAEGNNIFAPWTNPGTDNNSNISVVLKENNKGSVNVDCFVEDIFLSENTQLPPEEFEFTHNLIVPPGITLTINENTSLKFNKGASLIVKGKLVDRR